MRERRGLVYIADFADTRNTWQLPVLSLFFGTICGDILAISKGVWAVAREEGCFFTISGFWAPLRWRAQC